MENPLDFKIVVIGESGVGKSSIVLAFTNNEYNADHPATIGVDFKTKMLDLNGTKIKLSILDTAGQERFSALTPSYYRGAHGAILVYDVSEPITLERLKRWIEELQIYSAKDIPCLVVGNKADKKRAVDAAEGRKFAQRHRMLFIETSAKTKEGVQLAFEELAQKILESPEVWRKDSQSSNIRLQSTDEDESVWSRMYNTCC